MKLTILFLIASSLQAVTLDAYGGRTDLSCTGGTATRFYTERIGSRWWLCTPLGHAMWAQGVYAVGPQGNAVAKYGSSAVAGDQTVTRLKYWGYNFTHAYSTEDVAPWNRTNKIPTIGIARPGRYGMYASTRSAVVGPLDQSIKDIGTAASPYFTAINTNGMPDWGDLTRLRSALDYIITVSGEMANPIANNLSLDYLLGVAIEDSDQTWAYFGAGNGDPFDTQPSGRGSAHGGYISAISSPQLQADAIREAVFDTDQVLYVKKAWHDFLVAKYGTIGALNTAWGSTYTTFGSSATQVTGESIGTTDGTMFTYSHTLSNGGTISPDSIRVFADGVMIAGDCFHPNRGDACNPTVGTVTAGIWGPTASGGSINYSTKALTVGYTSVYKYINSLICTTSGTPNCTLETADYDDAALNATVGDYLTVKGSTCCNLAKEQITAKSADVGGFFAYTLTNTAARNGTETWTGGFRNQTAKVLVPSAGKVLTVDYQVGGWASGGTGLMDEDGRPAHTWMGTDPYALSDANPNTETDLRAGLNSLTSAYFISMKAGIAAAFASAGRDAPMYVGPDSFGTWTAPPRKEVLQAAAGVVDIGIMGSAEGFTLTQPMLDYIAQWYGHPFLDGVFIQANPDSPYSAFATSESFATQPLRGASYLNTVSSWLAATTSAGFNPRVGFAWWQYGDNTAENTNWGLVTVKDNAYDGVEAVTGSVTCSAPTNAYICGGEVANYGNVITSVIAANALWLHAGTIPVTVQGTTNTQAILSFSSTAASCTIEVSESPTYSPLVHDIDGSLFTGANADTGNANIVGNRRVWVIGKTNTFGSMLGVAAALDGNNDSRALQQATEHYYRVTCGSDTGEGTFTTRPVPLGNTYVPNQISDGLGNWLQPTLSYTDRAQVVIDPITGVALRRVVMQGDFVQDPGTYHSVTAGSGAAWTTPNNIAAPDTVYASYSGTAQAKLAATMYTGVATVYTLDFVTVKITGYGDGATTAVRTIQMCLSVDGSTCVSATKDLILPTSAGDVYYNQSLTIGDFMGWKDQLNLTVAAGMKLLIWKKATSGSDTIFLDNAQVGWGQSLWADPTSGGFHDIYGRTDSGGWFKAIVANSLYAIHSVAGAVRYMGAFLFSNFTMNGLIPDWQDVSLSACQTLGDSSRLFDQTDPNTIYCNGRLKDGSAGILRLTLDSTNTAVAPDTLFVYSTTPGPTFPLLLTPVGSDINTLVKAFDPLVLDYFGCALDARQGNYLVGTCLSNHQGSWGHLFVFSLGNGTSMSDTSCGSITAGKCSNSGVGIVAVSRLYDLVVARGCTVHTTRSNGDTYNFGWEIGGLAKAQDYGDFPTASALTADMDATQTTIHVTSAWQSGAVSKTGTISTAAGNYMGHRAPVTGTGTTFPSQITVGDTICAAGQCRVVTFIEGNTTMEVDTAFSPDLTGEAWTAQWPAQPSGYATGEPVGTRFPRWVNGARVNDFFLIGSETVRVTAKPSSTVWTVERGCNRDISLPYVPCTGTGVTHTSGDAVTIGPNSPQDVLNASSPATYWNFFTDPHAADTNYADWSNGSHGVILAAYPYGFGGGHNTARGNANGAMISMTDYVSMASNAAGGLATGSILTLPPNYTFQEHQATFGGKYPAGGFGNDYQRHPSNQHYNWGTGYFLNFFTDAPQFVNAGPVTSSTQVEGNVYKVVVHNYGGVGPHGLDRKYFPTLCLSGKFPLQDISGPTSHIVDSATAYTCCYAEAAGECRGSGDVGGASSAGDFYMAAPGVTSRGCTGSEAWLGVNDTCAGNKIAFGSGSVQYGVRVGDPSTIISTENHKRSRTLVTFGAGPRGLANYSNAKTIEGGQWLFSPAASNAYNQYLLANAKAMPPLDSIARDNFVPVKVTLNTPPGRGIDNAIVRFGYDPNFQCTSRAEGCVAAASNAPYFFASETFSGASCTTGCTIPVPALSSRMLYYQHVYRNGSAVVSTGPVQVQAVP